MHMYMYDCLLNDCENLWIVYVDGNRLDIIDI